MSPAKPAVTWYPAHEGNYTGAWRGPEPIDYIVIHVAQGSWSAAINWFQNPAANVSAHYVIRSHDGKIAQCVSDRNIAWHSGNWNYNTWSIGIEHEGYIHDPRWFTPEMYHASARLAAFLVRQWGIPPTRSYIIGHNEVPGADHTDPGRWWWWDYYMKLVRRYAST
ncbi:MAG: N-acetylmuramoyl-L-alanine amidase [Actinomycetota bacterium]|nr:N-acetylmuramoyl-L-alanine amidase [Actinomycetota bacterium]